jgi:hypothetical protein
VEGVGGGARHGGPAVTGGYSMKERWIRWLRPPRISSPSSQMVHKRKLLTKVLVLYTIYLHYQQGYT